MTLFFLNILEPQERRKMSNQNTQDWDTVVFRKKPVKKPVVHKKVSGSDDGYTTVKKMTGGTNTAASSKPKTDPSRLRKIADTEIAALPKVSTAMRQAISQGRTAKGLTQKDLAQKLNVKPSIIQDYENGKAIPDGQFLTRMEKILETKINGR